MSELEDALANPTACTELRFDFSEHGVLDHRVAALTELVVLRLYEVPPDAVLPEALLALPKLESLRITGKDDRLVLPELVRRLPIKRLDVSDLRAADLPPMPQLRELDIRIVDPREDVAILAERFSRLVRLVLGGDHPEGELPDDIERFSMLESLELGRLGITGLPAALAKLPALRELGIGQCNKLVKFPEVLLAMPRLEKLRIKTELAGLPSGLGQMTGLRDLDISWSLNKGSMVSSFDDISKLKPLPRALGELTNLERLDISCCGVTDIEVLRPLTRLKRLVMAWAGIETLEPLSGMTELEELSIAHCDRVKDLSPLGRLPRLRVLDLDNTEPRSLDVLREMPALRELHLEGIETKRLDAIYDLDVELHADDEVLERYRGRAALRGLPSLDELVRRLGDRDASIVEAALADLATWATAASTRDANAILALGIPQAREEDEGDDYDDDDDDDVDDEDDDEDDDDEDEDDAEGDVDDEGAMHAGPWLPVVDLALDRCLGTASPLVLAKLFGAVFHDAGDNFHAAVRIAYELVSRGGELDEAQCLLVDGFIKANEHHDAGHREFAETAHDLLIDRVFPLLGGPALAKLLAWAGPDNLSEEGDCFLPLFVPAFQRATGADREALLSRLETYLDAAAEYSRGPQRVDRVWQLLVPVSQGALGERFAQLRARLEAKLAVARRREDLKTRMDDPKTVAGALAEAAALPDEELGELQAGLWDANNCEGMSRDARRTLLSLWQRRDRDDGIAKALVTFARTVGAAELRDDLSVLTAGGRERAKIVRAAVLEGLLSDDYPKPALDTLRAVAAELDGLSPRAAASAEIQAMLFDSAKNYEEEAFVKGIHLLAAADHFEPPAPADDEDDDHDSGDADDFATMVASLCGSHEFEPLQVLARHVHKLKLSGQALERVLAQLVAACIVGEDPDGFQFLAPLVPPTVNWDILAYNLACLAAREGDRAKTFQFTARALELGKSPDQFLDDSDFESFHDDDKFVELLDSHR